MDWSCLGLVGTLSLDEKEPPIPKSRIPDPAEFRQQPAGQNAMRLPMPSTGGASLRNGFVSRSKHRGRMGPAISCSLRRNYWRSWRLWSPRPGSISYATPGSWPPGPGTATASCPPNRLRSRRRRTANRALRPAPIACGGRPCWRGCFPPTSANAPPNLPSRPGARRTAKCAFNAPSSPELIRIRADRQPEWTPSSIEGRASDPPGAA